MQGHSNLAACLLDAWLNLFTVSDFFLFDLSELWCANM